MKKIVVVIALFFISFSGYSIGRKHNTFATHKAIITSNKAAKLKLPVIKPPTDLKSTPAEDKDDQGQNFSQTLSLVQRAVGFILKLSSK